MLLKSPMSNSVASSLGFRLLQSEFSSARLVEVLAVDPQQCQMDHPGRDPDQQDAEQRLACLLVAEVLLEEHAEQESGRDDDHQPVNAEAPADKHAPRGRPALVAGESLDEP